MVKIISDSTCDLSGKLIEQYGISILPLHIHLGAEEYQDGASITPDEIFRWSDENKTTPKTSAFSLDEATELFQACRGEGDELVCFAIASGMSASMNVMRLAAEELGLEDSVYVIDSANLSTGIGHLVIEAAILAREGKNAAEIVAHVEALKPKVRSSFVVDTLTYLHRGGRCGGLAALAGGMLQLHPRIAVLDGKMEPGKKYRGKMPAVLLTYVKEMEEDLKNARPDRVFVTHSGCDEAVVNEVRSYLESLGVFHEILETRAGGIVSSHCGPGTLGVIFIAQD